MAHRATTNDPPEVSAQTAAEALRAGRLVVLPTETVYGVAASAASAEAAGRLTELAGPSGPPAWHAPTSEAAIEAVRPVHAAHRRLLKRLAPGPVTFLIRADRAELERIRKALSAAEGTLHDGTEMAVRVPDHELARRILTECGRPVVAVGLAQAGLGSGLDAPDRSAAAAKGIGVVVDDGPARLGKPSTIVRLEADGGVRVVRVGAVEERFVSKQLERTVLFVCTGNTCRSPMAEAIARHESAGRSGMSTRFLSAGVSATGGMAATPEAVEALKRLGVDPGRHRSRALSRKVIAGADVIYTMTPAHRGAVLSIDPAAPVQTLDPEGQIPDPIGGPQELYDRTARRLQELIRARLKELDQ